MFFACWRFGTLVRSFAGCFLVLVSVLFIPHLFHSIFSAADGPRRTDVASSASSEGTLSPLRAISVSPSIAAATSASHQAASPAHAPSASKIARIGSPATQQSGASALSAHVIAPSSSSTLSSSLSSSSSSSPTAAVHVHRYLGAAFSVETLRRASPKRDDDTMHGARSDMTRGEATTHTADCKIEQAFKRHNDFITELIQRLVLTTKHGHFARVAADSTRKSPGLLDGRVREILAGRLARLDFIVDQFRGTTIDRFVLSEIKHSSPKVVHESGDE
jgi:hypothetical protein